MKIFLSLFYLSVTLVLLEKSYVYFNLQNKVIEFQSLAQILNFIQDKENVFLPIFLTTILFSLISIFYKHTLFLILTNFFLLIAFSLQFSFGKINHSNHSWLICLILFSFLNINRNLTYKKNIFILRISQSLILSHFFISGLWKLRKIINTNSPPLKSIGLEHIAYSIAEGGGGNPTLLSWLFSFPELISFGFIIILIFQLSCIIPIIKIKHYILWGGLSICFHFSTGLVLGIWFAPNILIIVLVLIILEFLIKKDNFLHQAHHSSPNY